MFRYLTIISLLLPLKLVGQVVITGVVTDAATKKPLASASVFLSNATAGDNTKEDGSFRLSNVRPGRYDLVVTLLSYETYHYPLTVTSKNITLSNIELVAKSTDLKEVVVRPDPMRATNYAAFKAEFLGTAPEAADCKIINPDIVNVEFDAFTRKLTASSDDFILVENRALGYRIKYLLNKFEKDYKTGMLYFEGPAYFEELKGGPREQKRWLKNRDKAYYGSLAHYLRSALADNAEAEGFSTLRLERKPNPSRLPDSLIQAKLKYFRSMLPGPKSIMDSMAKWVRFEQVPKIVQLLYKTPPVNPHDLLKKTDQPGLYALGYKDCLYIRYTKSHNTDNQPSFHPLDVADNYPTTLVQFTAPYTFFDDNGSVVNPQSIWFDGAWGYSRVAQLLPVDFVPGEKK